MQFPRNSRKLALAAVLLAADKYPIAYADEPQLPSVTVHAPADQPGDLPKTYSGDQVARGVVHLGVLGKTSLMDAPFSITSYTSGVLQDMQARSVAEALARVDPSVRMAYGEGTSLDGLVIRGFPVANDEISLNGLPGILGQFRVAPEFAERVELLRGPSAMLSGMSPGGGVGGSVNIVSKKALDTPINTVTMGFAGHSLFGLNADLGRRLGEDNAFGVRINAGARQGDTARDDLSDQSRNLSVNLDYQSSNVRASLDMVRQSQRMRGAINSVSLAAVGGSAPAAPDGHRNFAQPWNAQDTKDTALMGQLEVDLSDQLTLFGAMGWSWNTSSALANQAPFVDANGNFAVMNLPIDWQQNTTSARLGVKGRFDTGTVQHDWSLSLSDVRRHSEALFYTSALIGGLGFSNIDNPVAMPAPVFIPGARSDFNWQVRHALPSVAIADTMSFAQQRVLLTLGLRHQRVKSDTLTGSPAVGLDLLRYDQSVLSPLAAVVFKATDSLSVYANHVQGLSVGDLAPVGTNNQGESFAPYRTRQWEAGVKKDWGTWTTTLSLFQISRPAGAIDPQTNTFGVNQLQRHRGLEVQWFGEITKGVRLLGGASFINAKTEGTAHESANAMRPVGVARKQATFAGEWDLASIPGLTLNARAVQTGSVFADIANRTKVPGWTVYDFGLRYATTLADKPVMLRAAVENAFNKRYWKQGQYTASLGMPRTLVVSSTVAF